MPNKGIEMDFEKLALSKTTYAQRSAAIAIENISKCSF